MGTSDDLISLPNPPPPRPAARREAIDAALRKFDGLEEGPARRHKPALFQWVATHRAATGGLVAAALIAVIAIPAIQVGIRDNPTGVATEDSLPERAPADRNAPDLAAANEPPPSAEAGDATIAVNEPPPQAKAEPAEERTNLADGRNTNVTSPVLTAPSPMAVFAPPAASAPAAPPPPPPPPAPEREPQAEAADSAGNIIVTGSRIPSANQKSSGFAQRAEAPPSPREAMVPYGEFLNRLQDALGGDDRRAVMRMVAIPLRVDFASGAKIYRTRQEVERDYDRIFTTAVRDSVLSLGSYQLTGRDGGKLRGSDRIWFGCGLRTCSSDETIKIRELTP